jgi:hypothetical protein
VAFLHTRKMLRGGRTCPIGVREWERRSDETAVARRQVEADPSENGILLLDFAYYKRSSMAPKAIYSP